MTLAVLLWLGGGLAGCAPVDTGTDVLRDETVLLSGTTRFQRAAFAGDWVTVACIGRCLPTERFAVLQGGRMTRDIGTEKTAYEQPGPGLLRTRSGTDDLVIMWVDEGFRTAAIGDVSGRWAAILDRTGQGGADRIAAAREILDFNGWDVSQIRDLKQ